MGRDEHRVPHASDEAMISIYKQAREEIGYTATYFLRMVHEQGGPDAARQLLHTRTPSEGSVRLWERRRLDLSVEYHLLMPRFRNLFSEDELEVARRRLTDYGFDPSALDEPHGSAQI